MKSYVVAGILFLIIISLFVIQSQNEESKELTESTEVSFSEKKLYWFIPDGTRADPDLFTIYEWAEEGKLPNIKKLMEEGSYGYSIPDFPSHTPTNFASLLTGTHPSVHGIADGPMHVEGAPLAKPSAAGFSSVTKRVPSIWSIMEENDKNVVLLSLPGSTPPELEDGITIRGRWGGWGSDTHKVVFESEDQLEGRKSAGKGFKLFFLGSRLTSFVEKTNASEWNVTEESFSTPIQVTLEAHGLPVESYIYDSSDDDVVNYDKVMLSLDKETQIANLSEGEWSGWTPVTLNFKGSDFDSDIKIKLIKIWENGNFRITILYNNLNKFITEPSIVAEELTENVGPMVDFADNWPPQLVYEDEDKETFLEEARMSWEWHRDAVPFIYDNYNPDVFIQDIYTPNQMLESRWWHQFIDETRPEYSEEKAEEAWDDILELYKGLDSIVGEAMKKADEETIIVFSSDHGVCSLHKLVRLNNLFAEKGWLNFTIDEKTGEPTIDWDSTKVVYLKMAHIYVNPEGLGGNWTRGSGLEYEILRQEVISELNKIEDVDGKKPVANAVRWEDASEFFDLPTDRVGDIVLEVNIPYFWFEELSEDLAIFTDPLTSGYKQTIDAKSNNCMWTPFIIWGPGVKAGYQLENPISHVDQLPTILTLMGIEKPDYLQGSVLEEILE